MTMEEQLTKEDFPLGFCSHCGQKALSPDNVYVEWSTADIPTPDDDVGNTGCVAEMFCSWGCAARWFCVQAGLDAPVDPDLRQ
jgi:hypothetical protein